jgi:hypothetical protein
MPNRDAVSIAFRNAHFKNNTHPNTNKMEMLLNLIFYGPALEEGLFGLLFFLAPDYFFNPQDGVLPLHAITKTYMETNHADKTMQICLAGAGASMLTLFVFRVGLAKTKIKK